jgi:membrane-associated phospholipid phosphatase
MSNIACFILALLSFKVSLHMVGVSGIFSFFLMLSIQYSININGTLALMSIVTGAVASSRLYLKAHNSIELITGIFIGVTPQIIVINYWF